MLAGDVKYTVAVAMSQGLPGRRIGVTCSIGARSSTLAATKSNAEVRMDLGAMALTRNRSSAGLVACIATMWLWWCRRRQKPRVRPIGPSWS